MKKILPILLTMASFNAVHAQKFEFGVSMGAAYNTTPTWGDYKMGYGFLGPIKNPHTTPVFFAKGSFNLKKWQLQLSAGSQTLKGRYLQLNLGRDSSIHILEDQIDFPFNQLNLSLNRMIILTPVKNLRRHIGRRYEDKKRRNIPRYRIFRWPTGRRYKARFKALGIQWRNSGQAV